MKIIKNFNLSFSTSDINFFVKESKKALKRGIVSESYNVIKFQNSFSRWIKSKFAIFNGSGTDSLDIAFRILDKKKKIILQANNFFAAQVALENSAKKESLYCDIELENLGIDPNNLEYLLKKNINKVDSVCLAHMGGIISKYIYDIKYLCKKFNVGLIEDAAHAHGSHKDNIYAGNFGDIGCFSFYPTKVMTTGEGGMIVFNNPHYLDLVKSYKNFGRPDNNPWVREIKGINSKVTEFQAILGLVEMNRVKSRIKKRNIIAARYKENLKDTGYSIIFPFKSYSSFYKIFVFHNKINPNKIEKILNKKNIFLSGKAWPYPLHKQPLYSHLFNLNLPNANFFTENHFCLPIYPELKFNEIDKICFYLRKLEKNI